MSTKKGGSMVHILSGKEIKVKMVNHNVNGKNLSKELGITNVWLSNILNEKSDSENVRAKATLYFNQLETKEE